MKDLQKQRKKLDSIDKKMAALFEERMALCGEIAEIKRNTGMEIEDKARESLMINENSRLIKEKYREYYIDFLKNNIEISKKFQKKLLGKTDLVISKGALSGAAQLLNLKRKVLIVTDTGVPKEYVNTVFSACETAFIYTFDEGENSKSLETVKNILEFMLQNGFDRGDCVVAVGGGVVGDVAGFSASVYMRGIEFYMIPTTTLSQVDSCLGGKTAVDFGGAKNTVGSFYFPSRIIIDPDVLKTLDKRNYNAGLMEAVKIGAILNEKLFGIFLKGTDGKNLETAIKMSLAEKKKIVGSDSLDNGTRRCLNFGHTVGHAIETLKGDLLHGECVAAGMLYTSCDEVKVKLKAIYERMGVKPVEITNGEKTALKEIIKKDKKIKNGKITAVFCEKIGSFQLKTMTLEEFFKQVNL